MFKFHLILLFDKLLIKSKGDNPFHILFVYYGYQLNLLCTVFQADEILFYYYYFIFCGKLARQHLVKKKKKPLIFFQVIMWKPLGTSRQVDKKMEVHRLVKENRGHHKEPSQYVGRWVVEGFKKYHICNNIQTFIVLSKYIITL